MTTQPAAERFAAARTRSRQVFAALPPAIHELGAAFVAAGFEFALVGGPVRDAVLGRSSADLDFTTDARPDDIEGLLARWAVTTWDVGREFGTIAAQRDGVVVEVTTYRTETYVPQSRKPDVTFGDTLLGDLSRRDFTVNAMAVRLPSLELVDPFDGLSDIAARVIRTPVAPEQSFDDDPLRMMRAVRFVSQLGFEVSDSVSAAVCAMAERIDIVSAERVRTELVKLFLGVDPRRGLELMVDLGLADRVLPELSALRLEVDEHHHHKDVYEHTLTVLHQAIALETGPDGDVPEPDLILRLAAIMHDIGKPATRRYESGGAVTFRHHEVVGAKLTNQRMRALRFDNDTRKRVARLVELHLRFHGYGDGAWTDSAVRRYVTDAGDLLSRLHRLTRADCTTRNRRRAARLSAAYDSLERRIAEIGEAEELAAVRPELDGRAIMEILDVPPGPVVGQAYAFLLDLRLERGPLGPDAARRELLAWWASRG